MKLEPGERRPEAVMYAVTERQVTARLPADVEVIGTLVPPLVPVG